MLFIGQVFMSTSDNNVFVERDIPFSNNTFIGELSGKGLLHIVQVELIPPLKPSNTHNWL